ncbi:riboflavin synthase [Campylobacter sp. VicNov18]|uniref:riboflavin synthase n=1 Tax=Campylobacter bilis TaxID=2691918 RepID=UPI00130D517E|nr:riboflavin synthase [Campylobacter bilis]MPV63159.1 riboflavin synthase [Campylobacter hepaticus]MBM0636659.1 riboflavin synthase [Campylobacter bilis]MCC8277503.1 riboflavin synthase [Campylobacter bilis]MCC8298708.1 riboflavin synthase [Campylobacter bilis]MCC8300412.1 riboflavin synthase [Campylobacter bilis]
MFNGLIREIAKVRSYHANVLSLKTKYRPNLGDSLAVNGACLSVINIDKEGCEVELCNETRKSIVVENLKDEVHIEPALRYGDRIDGHLMQGHIDFIGTLEKIQKDENGINFFISLPKEAMMFMAQKGSVGIDGVSLTINEVFHTGIRLTIIPITFRETLFKKYKIGRKINIESDLLARYIHVQLKGKEGLSWEEVERISYLY